MRKSKRVFSLTLAFSFLLSAAVFYSPAVFAESSSSNEAFEYEVNEDGESIKITSYRGLGGSVKIPSSIDDKEVTGIGTAAFASCSQIEILSIPVSVSEIDEMAFSGCSGIKEISIPDEVIEIGDMAFANCTSLEIVNFGEKLTKVGDYAFMGCTSLNKFILPDSTESIGKYAFYNCHSLEKLGELPNIKTIGGYAFENTAWINNYKGDYIILGDGLLISYRGKAKNLNLQENIKTVGASAFLNNKTVKNLKITKNTKAIQDGAFEGSVLENADLSATSVKIGDYTFANCRKLKEIKFSNKTSSVGEGVFKDCTSLKKIKLPDALEKLSKSAFAGCTALREVSFGSNIAELGCRAFENCKALGIIEIPESVAKIDDFCFADCVSLTRVVINGSPKINKSFTGCNNLSEVAFYGNSVSIDSDSFADSTDMIIYAAGGSKAEEFANEKHFEYQPLSEFEKTEYVYQGILKEAEDEEFSGGYTLIVILIIVADCIVAFSISAYVLLKGPGKRSMRHAKESKGRHSAY